MFGENYTFFNIANSNPNQKIPEGCSFSEIMALMDADDFETFSNKLQFIYSRLNEISKCGLYKEVKRDAQGNIIATEDESESKVKSDFITTSDSEPEIIRTYAASINTPYSSDNPRAQEFAIVQNQKEIISVLAACDNKRLKEIYDLRKETSNSEERWSNFLQDNGAFLNSSSSESSDTDGHNDAENMPTSFHFDLWAEEHKYENINGHIVHKMFNVQNSGLNLCIADGKIGILNTKQLNEDQWYALKDYFLSTGNFPATKEDFEALDTITVKRKIDGEEVNKPLGEALADEFYRMEEFYPEKYQKQLEAENQEQASRSAGTPPAPAPAHDGDDGADLINESYSFLPKSKAKENRTANVQEAYNAFKTDLGKMCPNMDSGSNSVSRTIFDWGGGGFTFSLWPDEASKRKDGEINTKNGTKGISTKIFACHIGGKPPKAKLFIPNSKNFTSDAAGAILKYFKKMGYDTFTLPEATYLGKETFKTFLEASVSEKMPLRLKHSKEDGNGMNIKVNDIKKLDSLISGNDSKLGGNAKDQINFLLRWSRELELYSKSGACNEDDAKSIRIYAMQYRQQARFKLFLASIDQLNEAINGPEVENNVDAIAAQYAMGRVVENIGNGKLPKVDENGNLVKGADGKIEFVAFNPAENNVEAAVKAIHAYMKAEKPNIERKVQEKINNNKDTSIGESKYNKAVNAVRGEYDTDYQTTIKGVTGKGGVEESSLKFVWPKRFKDDDNIKYNGTSNQGNGKNATNAQNSTALPTACRTIVQSSKYNNR